jgi:TatA/E family protein of Tat protein translocase
MPFNIGAPELIIILVIALLILGPGRLPEVGSSVGKAIREFRKASSDVEDAAKIDVSPLPTGTPAAPAAAAPVAPAPVAPAPAAPEAPVAAAPIQAAAAPSSEPTPGTN